MLCRHRQRAANSSLTIYRRAGLAQVSRLQVARASFRIDLTTTACLAESPATSAARHSSCTSLQALAALLGTPNSSKKRTRWRRVLQPGLVLRAMDQLVPASSVPRHSYQRSLILFAVSATKRLLGALLIQMTNPMKTIRVPRALILTEKYRSTKM